MSVILSNQAAMAGKTGLNGGNLATVTYPCSDERSLDEPSRRLHQGWFIDRQSSMLNS